MDQLFPVGLSRDGNLAIGGCDAAELAERYGTPLYVIDEEAVRRRCRRYRDALSTLPGGGRAVYAAKAFWVGGMARLIASERLGADVSSEMEMRIALASGLQPADLVLHGNNKSPREIDMAIELGAGRIVVDSLWELRQVEKAAERAGRRAPVLLRLVPDVRAGAHGSIQTGHSRSKFGIPVEGDQACQAARVCAESKHIELRGYHVHIGSQVLSLDPYREAARRVGHFAAEMAGRLGLAPPEVDMGGGLGVRYSVDDEPPSIENLVAILAQTLYEAFEDGGLYSPPYLIVEPGRSIVAEAGYTLYRVGAEKRLPSGERILAVDGGMSDNPRVALYQARYTAVRVRSPQEPAEETVQVVGRLCESGDVLVAGAALPATRPGDLLALLTTGAYHHAMSSNYNGLPRPAVVAVKDGQSHLWVRRETFETMTATDVFLQP